MSRGIEHFEASDDLFRRALSAGLRTRSERGGDVAPEAAKPPAAAWRSLRLNRLEGLDPEANIPPPLLALSPDSAFGVAEPEPEEPQPTPQELEEVLSEAIDLPDDWAVVAGLAGGTNTAQCLRHLLGALDWKGAPRQVAEALPDLHAPLGGSGAAQTLANLGFRCRSFTARLNELGPQDFPALFVTKSGDALVLEKFGQQAIPGFDGASRTRRPFARDRRAGTAYVFSPADASAANDPAPSRSVPDLIWTALRPRLAALTAASVGQAVSALAAPLLLLIALDHAVPSGALPIILFYAGAVVFACLAEFAFRVWRDRLIEPARVQVSGMAVNALKRTMHLPPAVLAGAGTGARQARYRDFLSGDDDVAPARIIVAAMELPWVIVALGGVALLGGELVAVPVLSGLLMLAGWALVSGALRRAKVNAVRAAGGFLQKLVDVDRVRGMVIAMGVEAIVSERLMRAAESMAQEARQDSAQARRLRILCRWMAISSVAATAIAAGYLGGEGRVTAGAVAAVVLLSWFAMDALARFAAAGSDAARVQCMLDQLRRLCALRPERVPGTPSVPPRRLAGHVDLSGVSTPAAGGIEMPLDDVSLYADPGEVVAVVGDYQSGKSALLRVLAGLQETRAGHVRLDGVETSLFDPVQLRQSVAYVPETPEFLPLTIEDNLRLMNPVSSDTDLQMACELAGVMDDIRVLETGVGSNRCFGWAVNMAQFTRDPHPGFFKRLALARGYLRNSGLVLLDGPERQLDPSGEQALLRAIEQLRGETTIVIATDRPQLIRLADRVLWLEGGRTRARDRRRRSCNSFTKKDGSDRLSQSNDPVERPTTLYR
jgi:ATP-binding cassette subfamily C protein/ATP-binding cassette subfamily C protein LapB